MFYHGGRTNTFTCYPQEKDLGVKAIGTARWEVATETMHLPGEFCSNHEYIRDLMQRGVTKYFCRGHTAAEDGCEEPPLPDTGYADYDPGPGGDEDLQELAEDILSSDKLLVLELGAGSGMLSASFAGTGLTAVPIDGPRN